MILRDGSIALYCEKHGINFFGIKLGFIRKKCRPEMFKAIYNIAKTLEQKKPLFIE